MKKLFPYLAGPPLIAALLLLCLSDFGASSANAQKIRLKDGRILVGKMSPISGVADNPIESPNGTGGAKSKAILVIDDDLRRVYVP